MAERNGAHRPPTRPRLARARGSLGRLWPRVLSTWLLLWGLIGGPVLSAAQQDTGLAKTGQADVLLAQGLELLRRGQTAEAVQVLERSLALEPRPVTWLNLGIAHGQLGHPQASHAALAAFLQVADPVRDQRALQDVRAELRRLETTNTQLQLAVKPPVDRVRIDGREIPVPMHIASSPGTTNLLVQPGPHVLEVSASGYAPHRESIQLPAGRFELAIELRLQPQVESSTGPATGPSTHQRQEPTQPAGTKLETSSLPGDATPVDRARALPTREPQPGANSASGPCWLGPTCLNAQLTVGVPNALGLEWTVGFGPYVSVAAAAQLLPTLTIDGTDVGAQLLSGLVRGHPFANGWFAGLGVGLQRLTARKERPSVVVSANLNTPALILAIGYQSRQPGLSFGIDLQLLIPLQNDELTVPPSSNPDQQALQDQLEAEANDAIDSVRNLLPILFQLNLIKVGYTF